VRKSCVMSRADSFRYRGSTAAHTGALHRQAGGRSPLLRLTAPALPRDRPPADVVPMEFTMP
jgi:hypothetical protein